MGVPATLPELSKRTLSCSAFDGGLFVCLNAVKDDRAFSLLHQELPQILALCFP